MHCQSCVQGVVRHLQGPHNLGSINFTYQAQFGRYLRLVLMSLKTSYNIDIDEILNFVVQENWENNADSLKPRKRVFEEEEVFPEDDASKTYGTKRHTLNWSPLNRSPRKSPIRSPLKSPLKSPLTSFSGGVNKRKKNKKPKQLVCTNKDCFQYSCCILTNTERYYQQKAILKSKHLWKRRRLTLIILMHNH